MSKNSARDDFAQILLDGWSVLAVIDTCAGAVGGVQYVNNRHWMIAHSVFNLDA